MLRRCLIPLAFLSAFVCAPGTARPPSAWADTPAPTPTAGSGSSTSGSALTGAPTLVPQEPAHEVAKPAALPDPNEHPAEAIGTVTKLWKGGQIPAAVIVGAFLLLSVLAKRYAWFNTGKNSAYSAAALGGLALVAEPLSQGGTPTMSMVGTAAITAVALLLHPHKTGETSDKGSG